MNPASRPVHPRGVPSRVLVLSLGFVLTQVAIAAPQFSVFERMPNREVRMEINTTAGQFVRIQSSSNLVDWHGLVTYLSAGLHRYTNAGAPYLGQQFYRAEQLSGTGHLAGDHLNTADGDVVIRPIFHASFVMQWKGLTIYNDPDSPTSLYNGLPKADLILISHSHGDHWDSAAVNFLTNTTTRIIAPQAVYNAMSTAQRGLTTILANNNSMTLLGLNVLAIPAYNANHSVGSGNGYIVTLGGRSLYMAGDTGDIAEMRALRGVDVAFVCMNVPFTMNVDQAISAVRQFQPRVVYPYHYRNQDGSFADLNRFKAMVGQDLGIEVRLGKWY